MSIETLRKILPPPLSPIESGKEEYWTEIEQKIGISLPSDYRDYITTFGTGYVGEFIWVFNPFASKPTFNLIEQIRVRLDAVRVIKQQLPSDAPFKLFPEQGGLLPCGATGNGDCLFWLTEGNPDEWPILVNESRGPDWAQFNMRLTDFLAGVIRREISCEIFPTDFPGQRVIFAPRR